MRSTLKTAFFDRLIESVGHFLGTMLWDIFFYASKAAIEVVRTKRVEVADK